MSATLKPYPEYKDSSVPWLGKIPKHWNTSPLKALANVSLSSVDKLSKLEETEVRFLGTNTVYSKATITNTIELETVTASKAEIRRFGLLPDDIVLTKDSVVSTNIAIPAYVSEHLDNIICGYHLALIRSRKDTLQGKYLFWLLNSRQLNEYFLSASTGTTIIGIGKDTIARAYIALPPHEEQSVISSYLDNIDRRINRFIRVKKRLIGLLNEQREAIIQRVVTRGVVHDVSLKSSGVDWLGDVPEHWEVKRLKRIFREVDRRSISGTETLLSLRMYRGLVPHEEVSEKPISSQALIGFKTVMPSQVVMNRMRAAIGMFAVAPQSGIVSPDYAVFVPDEKINPYYYVHLFKTPSIRSVFRSESKGLGTGSSGFLRLYSDRFGLIKVPVPPIGEQAAIVQHIQEATVGIETTIARTQREIDLIREYRTRLIADVVSGKLDVRGVRLTTVDEIDVVDESEAEVMEEGETLEPDEEGVYADN